MDEKILVMRDITKVYEMGGEKQTVLKGINPVSYTHLLQHMGISRHACLKHRHELGGDAFLRAIHRRSACGTQQGIGTVSYTHLYKKLKRRNRT